MGKLDACELGSDRILSLVFNEFGRIGGLAGLGVVAGKKTAAALELRVEEGMLVPLVPLLLTVLFETFEIS